MTTTEIRIKAQNLFDELVIAIHNDNYGQDDGSRNILTYRFCKAIAWAKENGEYNTLKAICHQKMSKAASWEMRAVFEEALSLFEI